MPRAVIALAAFFLVGLFSTELSDPDFWWHLKTGEYLTAQHRLPVPDPFAWTTAGVKDAFAGESVLRQFNLTHEWLAQVWLYGIWSMGGFGAIVLWKALLLSGVCGLSGWVAARRTGQWMWGVAAALSTASLATVFASDRPALITFLFVALFIAIYERGGPWWMVPALAVVWANCHGGFFLGWVVCGAYGLEALVRRAPDAKKICLVGAAAAAASLLNPNGWRALQAVALSQQSVVTSSLIEWRKPYLWGPPYAFDVLLYAAAVVLLLAWRRVRIADWVLFVAFGVAALMAWRNMMLIAIAAPFLIAAYFPWKRPVPAVFAWPLLAAVGAGTFWGVTNGASFQLRAAEWRYPSGAAEFLAANRVQVPVFNTYEYGGYLIWRGQRVFIDGRSLSDGLFEDYRKILGSPPGDPMRSDTLRKYGIGAIVMNGFEYTSGVLYPLALAVGNPADTEWKLVYEDAQSMVFLREVPPGMPVLEKTRVTTHLMAECGLHIERDPEFSLCARTLADRFLQAGDRERARRMLGLYIEHPYGDDPQARRQYQQLLQTR
jgi:hypothetical protein